MKTELTSELRTSLCICDAKTIFSARCFCAITRNLKYESILNVKTGAAGSVLSIYRTLYCIIRHNISSLWGFSFSYTNTNTHTHTAADHPLLGGLCVTSCSSPHQEIKGCHSLCGSGSDKTPDAVSQLEQGLRVLPPSEVGECVWCVSLCWHHRRSSSVPIKDGPFAMAAQ